MQKPRDKSHSPIEISDADIYRAMSEIQGYLDITPGDFKEIYLKAFEHALRRLRRTTAVGEVMTREVAFAVRTSSISEIAELMARHRISGLPVLNADKSVAGVISERDFIRMMWGTEPVTLMDIIASSLKGGQCFEIPDQNRSVEHIMSSPAITVRQEATLMEAAGIMEDKHINRLPVVDHTGKLIGIVSRADIVRSFL